MRHHLILIIYFMYYLFLLFQGYAPALGLRPSLTSLYLSYNQQSIRITPALIIFQVIQKTIIQLRFGHGGKVDSPTTR